MCRTLFCQTLLCSAVATLIAVPAGSLTAQELDWIESAVVSPINQDGVASITLSGVWGNTCTPNSLTYEIEDQFVQLTATTPSLNVLCGEALTPWSLSQDIEPLEGYRYAVATSVFAVDPENPDQRKRLAAPQRIAPIWPRRTEFYGLGSTAEVRLSAFDVSANGSVVVGNTLSPSLAGPGREQAMLWTTATGSHDLGFLDDANLSYRGSSAFGVSANGRIAAGHSSNSNSTLDRPVREAFRWQRGNVGMRALSDQELQTTALAVSVDGQVVVGTDHTSSEHRAFRWTSDDGIQFLSQVFPNGSMRGLDVSADGNTVVGQAIAGPLSDDYGLQSIPYVWRPDTGVTKLHLADPCPACGLAAGIEDGAANAVSADGNYAVGFSRYRYAGPGAEPLDRIQHAVRWDTNSRRLDVIPMMTIRGMRGWSVAMEAIDVSEDGSLVVGMGSVYETGPADPLVPIEVQEAFIWDNVRRTRSLREVLEKDAGLGLELEGWDLGVVTAISDDGSTIVGNGVNPAGIPAAWRANLDHGFVAGDTNFDGSVNFADFLVLSGNFGKPDQFWSTGDFTGDGKTTFADFLLLSGNFGGLPTEPAVRTIPEPSGCVLVLLAMMLGLLTRSARCGAYR